MRLRDNLYQRIIHILTGVVFIAMWFHIILVWGTLPDRIPTHFNAAGEIDGWGGKGTLLFGPVIGTVTLAVLLIVERFPKAWNTGVKVTPLNQVFVYRTLKSMMVTLELSILLIFWMTDLFIIWGTDAPIWLVPVILLLTFVPVVFFLVRLSVGSKKFRI